MRPRLVKAQAEPGSPDRFVDIGKRGIEFALLGQAVATKAISRRKPLAGLFPGIDDGAARRHLLIRRGGRADAGLPDWIDFSGCGTRSRAHQGCAQQRSGQAGHNAHDVTQASDFPLGRLFASMGSRT